MRVYLFCIFVSGFAYASDAPIGEDSFLLIDRILNKSHINGNNNHHKNVENFLNAGQHKEAEQYIKTNIDSNSDSYKKCYIALVNYFIKKNKLGNAEEILDNFRKGERIYEELATIIFRQYLNKDDILSAQFFLEKNFIIASLSYEILASNLFDYHFENLNLIEAENVLKKHLVMGSFVHEKCAAKIFNLYSLSTNFNEALFYLQNNFVTGHPAKDKLAKILALHLIKENNFNGAKIVLIRNMSRLSLEWLEQVLSDLKTINEIEH